jgi:glycosyltransferase involved in cell wall biosynthesis
MMNILITQTAYPPSVGGAQVHMHQLARKLSIHHSVKVACFWSKTRTDWLLGTTWFAPNGKKYIIDEISVTPLGFSLVEKLKISPWVLGYYVCKSTSIKKIAEKLMPQLHSMSKGVDIIHHGRVGREPLAYASLMLARDLKIPFIITPFHHPRWSHKFYKDYHQIYKQADAINALTPFEVEMIEDLGISRENIHVTGTGGLINTTHDADQFRKKYDLQGPIVLFIGQKYAYKGFSQVLDATQFVWEKFSNVHFVFIGPRTAYSRIRFSKYHDRRIVEIGTVDLETKTSALEACDILCVPSTQESFGGVFVEAWHFQKPVIGANIGAVSHVISDGVDGFVGSQEPSYIAEKLIKLLSDPLLCRQMGEAGNRKAASKYSWAVLAEKSEEIYKHLIEK